MTPVWSREQADKYAELGGYEAADRAKTGKRGKTPLMRVEHDAQYAIVASLGGGPAEPRSGTTTS
jgi:F420H(2)-dependent quinone reductase